MVTVRGRKKSVAPRMVPPRVIRRRTESESEEELLEEIDSNVSNDANEATFIQARVDGDGPDGDEPVQPRVDGVETVERVVVEPKTAEVPLVERTVKQPIALTSTKKPSQPAPPKNPSNPDLDTTNGSNDSGHSEMMDTTVKPTDDDIPGFHAAVSLMEESIRTTFPVTARPPCTVDAEMVRSPLQKEN